MKLLLYNCLGKATLLSHLRIYGINVPFLKWYLCNSDIAAANLGARMAACDLCEYKQ